jgi:hypothetical protein
MQLESGLDCPTQRHDHVHLFLKNSTVTQSNSTAPCLPLEGSVDSGFEPVSNETQVVLRSSRCLSRLSLRTLFRGFIYRTLRPLMGEKHKHMSVSGNSGWSRSCLTVVLFSSKKLKPLLLYCQTYLPQLFLPKRWVVRPSVATVRPGFPCL